MEASASPNRSAGSLPFPDQAVGTVNNDMPFDHLVVVMMENHSFDNVLGSLAEDRDDVEGLSFEGGQATNKNPGTPATDPEVTAFALRDTSQAPHVTQSWKATHEQINGGAMDGFVRTSNTPEPMGYYTREVLPFAYSLASQFTLANRWFSSVPGPTYPNRRFLLAGTAYGCTTTALDTLFDGSPPHGTIFDRLSEQHISWCDYFTDVPMTMVIPGIILKHLDHHHKIDRFYQDCKNGTLPQVSFVDPGAGVLASLISHLGAMPTVVKDALKLIGAALHEMPPGETEEDPQSMYYGELWAHGVLEAVLQSPQWERTLLIYLYDEHGGYFDHVEPPAAPKPDGIAPRLQPGDPPGDYDMYGPRVPAVVVSPYSRRGGVCNDDCDHTSVLATIEHKWNLPALTDRDANAATIMGFLDSEPTLAHPDPPDAPSDTGSSGPTP